MGLKLKLMTLSLASGLLLLVMLCLGAQNLNERHSLKLGIAKTAPLPTGFLVGISIIIGVVSGGATAALLLPPPRSQIIDESN